MNERDVEPLPPLPTPADNGPESPCVWLALVWTLLPVLTLPFGGFLLFVTPLGLAWFAVSLFVAVGSKSHTTLRFTVLCLNVFLALLVLLIWFRSDNTHW